MKIFVDIDETICSHPETNKHLPHDYTKAIPNYKNITAINSFYQDGHEITYWTARGSSSGLDWTELTYTQLQEWGAKYHHLKLGKPSYDLYIDDKSINVLEWEKAGRCLPDL